MLSLLLTLSLGQTVYPPANAPPFGFSAPLEPIRLEGAPSMVRVGGDLVSVWVDRRRGLDQIDAGVDVWAGTATTGAAAFSTVLLTPQARSCFAARLAGDRSGLVAAWSCSTVDGGVIESAQLPSIGASHLPLITVWPDNGSGPVLDLRLVASPARVVAAVRRPGSISLLQSKPPVSPLVITGSYASHSLVFVEDGGVMMLGADGVGGIFAFDALSTGGALGPTPVGMGASRVLGLDGKQPHTYFFETASKEVRRRLVDGGLVVVGGNASAAEPLVASIPVGGLAVFLSDAGVSAQVARDVGGGSGAAFAPSGLPVALAGASPDFLVAEAQRGEVTVRPLTLMSSQTPSFGVARSVFLAPRPQIGLAATWSPNDNAFITLWDQRDGGAWETRSGLVDDSGPFELWATVQSAGPSRPSLATAPDGGVYVALTDDLGRSLFEVIGGTVAARTPGPVFDEIAVGASSAVSWSPSMGVVKHATTGTSVSAVVPPGCVTWSQGNFAFVSGGFVMMISEAGLVGRLEPVPASLMPPLQQCLVITASGRKLVTASNGAAITVHRLDTQREIGFVSVPLAGTPASVAVDEGVLVVANVVPDGQRGTVRWHYFTDSFIARGSLNDDTQPVRNVRAVKSPLGDVLASWETFELDGGSWQVQARLIRGPFLVDGGGLDAGAPDAGGLDASVPDEPDAGVADAGVSDAGVPDSGVSDSGVSDAGVPDAGRDSGVLDAGVVDAGAVVIEQVPTYVPVCGCSSVNALSSLMLALLLLLRGRR